MDAAEGRRTFALRVGPLMGMLILMFGLSALVGVAGLAGERAEAVFLCGNITGLLLIIVLCRRWAGPMPVVATLVVAFLASVALFMVTPVAVLAVRGRPTTAVVVSVADVASRSRSAVRREWRYALVDPAGRPIPGRLIAAGPFWQVGDQVDVLVDPAGRIDPHEVGDVLGGPAPALVAGSLVVAAAGLAVLSAARSTRARRTAG